MQERHYCIRVTFKESYRKKSKWEQPTKFVLDLALQNHKDLLVDFRKDATVKNVNLYRFETPFTFGREPQKIKQFEITLELFCFQDEKLFEYNARNQITLWGPNGEIKDYANKQWSGQFTKSAHLVAPTRHRLLEIRAVPTSTSSFSLAHRFDAFAEELPTDTSFSNCRRRVSLLQAAVGPVPERNEQQFNEQHPLRWSCSFRAGVRAGRAAVHFRQDGFSRRTERCARVLSLTYLWHGRAVNLYLLNRNGGAPGGDNENSWHFQRAFVNFHWKCFYNSTTISFKISH